jgi:transposase
MPWQECSKVDERLRFVARLLEGEKMSDLCREFDISRKTGYKIFTRYQQSGLEGLTDRSRRPYRQANRLPELLESRIVQLRREHPSWGAPKIREKLKRQSLGIALPAISTVHAVLDRHGLVSRGRRPRTTRHRERRCRTRLVPMRSGAPTTRESSCSPIGATAIR